jgi:hypothetical protein
MLNSVTRNTGKSLRAARIICENELVVNNCCLINLSSWYLLLFGCHELAEVYGFWQKLAGTCVNLQPIPENFCQLLPILMGICEIAGLGVARK